MVDAFIPVTVINQHENNKKRKLLQANISKKKRSNVETDNLDFVNRVTS